MPTIYRRADMLNNDECESFNLERLETPHCGHYLGTDAIRCVREGEFRRPLAGEWYLSGSTPEAYRAPSDLSSEYHIVTLVRTETVWEGVTKIVS